MNPKSLFGAGKDTRFQLAMGSVAVVSTVVAILATQHPEKAFAALQRKPLVYTQAVKAKEISDILTYPARVEPRIRASVVAENDGVVSKIYATLGRTVKSGTPILVIRNTDPVYQYAPMVVPAPVAGVVSRVDVTEGSRVARGDKLVMVTDPDQARVVVEITAEDVGKIKPGLTAELKLPGDTASESGLKVRVKGISPFVDPSTGTASCELELVHDSKSKKHLPVLGVIGRVIFSVNSHKGISIPDSAITYRGKDPFVRVVNAGKAKLVAIETGHKEAGIVEILHGLKSGDQLIERTTGFVADGEAVDAQALDGAKESDKSEADKKVEAAHG